MVVDVVYRGRAVGNYGKQRFRSAGDAGMGQFQPATSQPKKRDTR
jgi:hypothetical protein